MSTNGIAAADIVAIVALIIAVLAMVATFWQASITRRHNRLSVRPLLTRSQYREWGPKGLRYTLGITNVGIGPAVVKERYFQQNGNRLSFPSADHPVLSVLRSALGSKVEYTVVRYGLPAIGTGIAPQFELVVFELLFPALTERTSPLLDDLARGLSLVVEYESLYGEKATLHVVAE